MQSTNFLSPKESDYCSAPKFIMNDNGFSTSDSTFHLVFCEPYEDTARVPILIFS